MNKNEKTIEVFHIGNIIKDELHRQGRTITWLSTQVNSTRDNLYKMFRRPWIYTDLLLDISIALNYDFFKLYSEQYGTFKNEDSHNSNNINEK